MKNHIPVLPGCVGNPWFIVSVRGVTDLNVDAAEFTELVDGVQSFEATASEGEGPQTRTLSQRGQTAAGQVLQCHCGHLRRTEEEQL